MKGYSKDSRRGDLNLQLAWHAIQQICAIEGKAIRLELRARQRPGSQEVALLPRAQILRRPLMPEEVHHFTDTARLITAILMLMGLCSL